MENFRKKLEECAKDWVSVYARDATGITNWKKIYEEGDEFIKAIYYDEDGNENMLGDIVNFDKLFDENDDELYEITIDLKNDLSVEKLIDFLKIVTTAQFFADLDNANKINCFLLATENIHDEIEIESFGTKEELDQAKINCENDEFCKVLDFIN